MDNFACFSIKVFVHTYQDCLGATVKFLNFGTAEIFAVIHLKFKQRGQTVLRVFCQNGANGIANSEDPLGAV